MRFNIGDTVLVRDDLITGEQCGKWVFDDAMAPYSGKIMFVTHVLPNSKGYLLIAPNEKLGSSHVWTEEMLK